MKLNNTNTVFCTGMWYFKENVKRDLHHYFNCIPKTFKYIDNQRIYFFYNHDKILDFVNQFKLNNYLIPIKMEIEQLPTYSISEYYLNSCKNQDVKLAQSLNKGNEKIVNHYLRDYIGGGETCYRNLFTIWTSKIFLIKKVLEEEKNNNKLYAWFDISISRFFNNRDNWNILENDYDKNFFYHYDSFMNYLGNKINLNASFMLSSIINWKIIIESFNEYLEKEKNNNLAHDEETLVNLFYSKYNFFKKLNNF